MSHRRTRPRRRPSRYGAVNGLERHGRQRPLAATCPDCSTAGQPVPIRAGHSQPSFTYYYCVRRCGYTLKIPRPVYDFPPESEGPPPPAVRATLPRPVPASPTAAVPRGESRPAPLSLAQAAAAPRPAGLESRGR